jgi:hypothetical protein
MPGVVRCADSAKIYDIKITYLGSAVGLVGSRATPRGMMPLNYACVARYQAVPSAVSTQILFECRSGADRETVQVFRNTETQQFWGLLIGLTKNGVPRPIDLSCESGI